jgi:hypothetical protein
MPGLVAAHVSMCVYLRELCKIREIVEGEKVRLLRGGERSNISPIVQSHIDHINRWTFIKYY